MAKFCEFEKTTSDRLIYVNSDEIMMVSYGEDNNSSTVELSGQRSFLIKGNVKETMVKIKSAE